MSPELNAFFAKVSSDLALQEQLYQTKNVADVAVIARGLGFKVMGAEILRAQAGRVLSLPLEELERVAAGNKAKSGAQWGRGGQGYLDRVGFWINEFMQWGYIDLVSEPQIRSFFAQVKKEEHLHSELLLAKTCKDVADLANKYGYEISSADLARCHAEQILKLTDKQAEKVASGGQ